MIRQADINDCKEISRICTDELGYHCKKEFVEARIKNIDSTREVVFAALDNNKVIGFIHLEKYRLLYSEDMVNVLGLAVAGAFQHQGYGRALVEAAEQWAKNNNIHILRLNSGAGRIEAHKFYRAVGFLNEKEQKRFIRSL